MLEVGDLITLSNKKEYLVVDQIEYDDNDYVILTSKDGISELKIYLKENDVLSIVKEEEKIKNILLIYSKLNGDINE